MTGLVINSGAQIDTARDAETSYELWTARGIVTMRAHQIKAVNILFGGEKVGDFR